MVPKNLKGQTRVLGILVLFTLMTTCQSSPQAIPFPQNKDRAVILTWDDGMKQDQRLVNLMNQYGIRGTFYLNTDLLGEPVTWTKTPTRYLTAPEAQSLYLGQDLGGHTLTHPNLLELDDEDLKLEILEDKKSLESLFNRSIKTFAYPFGLGGDREARILDLAGYTSGRLISRTDVPNGRFSTPRLLVPNAHVRQAPKLLKDILGSQGRGKILIFWGHSWELDQDEAFGWDHLEDLLRTLTQHPEIWTLGLGDLFPD